MLCIYTKLILNDEGRSCTRGSHTGELVLGHMHEPADRRERRGDRVDLRSKRHHHPTTISPYTVALEAEKSLRLPAPTSYFNPLVSPIVNLSDLAVDRCRYLASPIRSPRRSESVGATTVATRVASPGRPVTVASPPARGPGSPFDAGRSLLSDQSTGLLAYVCRFLGGEPSVDREPR